MVPFMPPPPNCTARPFHVTGKATWKLIDLAFGAWSTGAIEPLTLHQAEGFLPGEFHRGALSVTADTGSPIAGTGMLSPSFPAVQSASVMVRLSLDACALARADKIRAATPAKKTIPQRACFMT
jgi:hypothetical protein